MTRFAVAAESSHLSAAARSTVHSISFQAPLTGAIDAAVRDGRFDVTAAVTASLEVDLKVLRGNDPLADAEMRRRLDIQRYPLAMATVSDVTAKGGDLYRLRGALSLHGKTQPVEGDATVTLTGARLHASGSLTIDIRQFGIKPPSLLLVRVHPEVEIAIDLVADRSDPAGE